MINTLAIANYRSLRNIVVPLSALNLVSGENGSGKSRKVGRYYEIASGLGDKHSDLRVG